MPVPYRKTPRAAEVGQAAYLDILYLPADRTFYGGLLILDGKGQPQEFVHNTLAAPSGALWPEDTVLSLGVVMLVHSLFDACRREPDLLVSLPSLGSPEMCRTEIAPSIPFAQVAPAEEGIPAEWNWINEPPSSGMRAAILAQELARRGFIVEPFERLRYALRMVYPQAAWYEVAEDGL
ncbi:MAG: hypothetical protein JWL77_5448 [Chthonomonadaceae bacterium]|nr:hypothetical protein [Chthonomonadaceae bacterium]